MGEHQKGRQRETSAQSKCLTFKALFLEKGNRAKKKKKKQQQKTPKAAGRSAALHAKHPKSQYSVRSNPGHFFFFFFFFLCEISGSPKNDFLDEWMTALGDRNERHFSPWGLKSSARDGIGGRVLLPHLQTTVRLIFDESVWGISQQHCGWTLHGLLQKSGQVQHLDTRNLLHVCHLRKYKLIPTVNKVFWGQI